MIVSDDATKIAGDFTIGEWKEFSKDLKPGKPDKWELAYKIFFRTRVEKRYFEPIRLLQEGLDGEGEGLEIVAFQRSLIEFFQSTIEGK
jgi:hypothetical protein